MPLERLTARRTDNGLAYLVKVKNDEQEVDSPYPNTLEINELQSENAALKAKLADAEARETWLKSMIERILPGAMSASCKYSQHEQADKTWHCCDWSEVVEEIQKLTAREG